MPPIVANTDRFGKACVSVRRKKSTARERIWGSLSSPCAEVIADQRLSFYYSFLRYWSGNSTLGHAPAPGISFSTSVACCPGPALPGQNRAVREWAAAGAASRGTPGAVPPGRHRAATARLKKMRSPVSGYHNVPQGSGRRGGQRNFTLHFAETKGRRPTLKGQRGPTSGAPGQGGTAPGRRGGHGGTPPPQP
jgi:hypothetical protein